MFNGRSSHRGQVLILFVFAVIGLVGITGVAIDGGNIYADRRHAQNAADTAALAAAVVKIDQEKGGAAGCTDLTTPSVCGALVKNAALDMARTNGYNSNVVDNTVEVHLPPIDGPYSDCSSASFDCEDYIQVIIHDNVNTWFARVIGIAQLHNRVESVALAKYSPQTALFGGSSLVELGQGQGQCPSDFNVGGNGHIILDGGGIWVNSDNQDCAYKQTSCSAQLELTGNPPATIQVIGGSDVNGCNSPPITPVTKQYKFPPDHLLASQPSECATQGTYNTNTKTHTTTYNPGSYIGLGNFPLVTGTSYLNPGVYCVDSFQNNKDLTGNGVFIYMPPTGSVYISGGNVVLTAPTTPPYQGYLIYQDWDNSSTVQNCKIVGNDASQYTGLIFVPYCDMEIAGTSSSTGFMAQIIAYTLSLNGTNDLYFTYNANDVPQLPEIDQTGLFH